MLNHDVGVTTFDKYKEILEETETSWASYMRTDKDASIGILSENELLNLIDSDKSPTTTEESIRGDAVFMPLRENTIYFINGKKYNDAGFWTSTDYDDDYAYSLTEYGNNRLVRKDKKRGIRPVIIVDKSLVTGDKTAVALDLSLKYEYEYLNKKYSNVDTGKSYIYKQMQGFTMAGDKLFFYSSHNGNPNKGLLFGYGGSEYSDKLGYIYGDMAHGNDMTYNPSENTVYIIGAEENKSIWGFDVGKFPNEDQPSKKFNFKDITYQENETKKHFDQSIGAIAYDNVDDIYFVNAYSAAIAIDNNFSAFKDGFSYVYTETGQGFDWHNGYLYVATFEIGSGNCPNAYQLYCYGDTYTGTIYVYNAKYNSDGSPSPNFGKLVARYRMPAGIGELETVSFDKNGDLILGVAAHYCKMENDKLVVCNDKTPYQMYSTSVNVKQTPSYSLEYSGDSVTITSVEDLKPISDDWTLSPDKKTLSKTLTENEMPVEVCDRYDNCATQNIKPLDTITFEDSESTYTGNSITVNNASAKSGSTITYTYYSDQTCTSNITSVINAGTYSVKAVSAGNDSYVSNSKCAKLTVNKGIPTITASDKVTNYTGNYIIPDVPTAKALNNTNVDLDYSYIYYSDNECKNISSAPVDAGIYYYKASSSATSNLNIASSSCKKIQINKVDPTISVQSSVQIPVFNSTDMDIQTNSNGTITCSSSNKSILNCYIVDSKLRLETKHNGDAVVTLSQAATKNFNEKNDVRINVTVSNSSVDTVGPMVSISPTEDSNYTKNKDITVIFKDDGSFINGEQDVFYAFSNSNTVEPTYSNSLKLSSVDEKEKKLTIPKTEMDNLTGTYYLWIKSGIKDSYNNVSQKFVSKALKFNNSNPEVTASVIKSKNKIKGTVSISSLSTILSKEYSIDNVHFKSFSNDYFIDDLSSNVSKCYIRVKDYLNHETVIESDVKDEEQANIEFYVVDSNNNNITNNIINLSDKELYYHLYIKIPKLENLYDKYFKFSITNEFDNNLKFDLNSVIILDKASENVTNLFDLVYENNKLSITPKNISASDFYDEIYDIMYHVTIPDNSAQLFPENKIINKASLAINDDNEIIKITESHFEFESYEDIPNTFSNLNNLIIIGVILLIIIGGLIIIFISKKVKKYL